jgi:hypothetical protein
MVGGTIALPGRVCSPSSALKQILKTELLPSATPSPQKKKFWEMSLRGKLRQAKRLELLNLSFNNKRL